MTEKQGRQGGAVTDFVLGTVKRWAELNGEKLKDGEQAYVKAAANGMRRQHLSEANNSGVAYDVFGVQGHPTIVFKRLHPTTDGVNPGDLEKEQEAFVAKQAEHRLVKSFLGSEFVPDTVHIAIEDAEFPRKGDFVTDGFEFGAIQEKAGGELDDSSIMTPSLKQQMNELARRYTRMMRKALRLPEDELQFDLSGHSVLMVDTSNLIDFEEYVKDNAFLKRFLGDDYVIQSPAELRDVIMAHHPGFRHYQGQPWEDVREEFRYESESYFAGDDQGNYTLTEPEYSSMEPLFQALKYFPPEGPNDVVREWIAKGWVSEDYMEEQRNQSTITSLFRDSFRFSQGEINLQRDLLQWLVSNGYIDRESWQAIDPEKIAQGSLPKRHSNTDSLFDDGSDSSWYVAHTFTNLWYQLGQMVHGTEKQIDNEMLRRICITILNKDIEYQTGIRQGREDVSNALPDGPNDQHASQFRKYILNKNPTGSDGYDHLFATLRTMLAEHINEDPDLFPNSITAKLYSLAQAWEIKHPDEKFFTTEQIHELQRESTALEDAELTENVPLSTRAGTDRSGGKRNRVK